MKFVIVALLIFPIISPEELIPIRNESARGISEKPATKRQFPWLALITSLKSHTICGGALITPRWVLSTAFCFLSQYEDDFKVVLGTIKFKPPYDDGSVVIITNRVIEHPSYNYEHHDIMDIAVVDLKKDVKLSANIQTIALGKEPIGTGVSVTAIGWGSIYYPERYWALHFINLTTISNKECFHYYHYDDYFDDIFLCCDGSPFHSTCFGDHGGPLVKYGRNGKAVLVGLIRTLSLDCTHKYPSGYIRVEPVYKWILETIKN